MNTSFIRHAINRSIDNRAEKEATMDAAADLFLDNGNYLSSDDELDSCSPLIDLYIQDYGNNSVINVMTPFTFREFEKLWDLV